MGKPHTIAVNKYNAKAFDRISLMVPKGRKDDIKAAAAANGETLIGFINRCVREKLDMDENEWNSK